MLVESTGHHQDDERNNLNAPTLSPPQDRTLTSAAADAPHADHELPPEILAAGTARQSSNPKYKAPETAGPDNLDKLFTEAWNEVDRLSDKEVAQRFPWSTNVSNSGVSPSKAGQIFESMEKD